MKPSNIREYSFGKSDITGLRMMEYDFENGAQILGIFGKVAFDENEVNGDELLTIGFFKDECSATK